MGAALTYSFDPEEPSEGPSKGGVPQVVQELWEPGQACTFRQACAFRRWAIMGAGPVGLSLAIQVADLMRARGLDRATHCVTVYEPRIAQSADGTWKRSGRRRDQVVTIQNNVVGAFEERHPEIYGCFKGEVVWRSSRNVAIADIEDRLLELAQRSDFIELQQAPQLNDARRRQSWLRGLDADVAVLADGAASPSREALQWPRTDLGATKPAELEVADYALGISLKGDVDSPQSQAMNVVLTLCQNRYLLNSEEGKRGYLNIRITKDEYDQLFRATGKKGCPFGSPIQLYNPFKPQSPGTLMLRERVPWLENTIRDGLTWYGMSEHHCENVVGIQLRPAYAEDFFRILKSNSPGGKHKLVLLIGDAAISHHFWPGRGLNTGLKSAIAVASMWFGMPQAPQRQDFAYGLWQFQDFMTKLRKREMQGRSESMIKKENALPRHLINLAVPDEATVRKCHESRGENDRALLEAAKAWRSVTSSETEPSDEELERKIQKVTTRPSDITVAIMRESARQVNEGMSGWPVHQQRGEEVLPETWQWARPCHAWMALALQGGGAVSGRHYDAKACYEEALCSDRDNAEAWFNLAAEGGGNLAGNTKKACYEEALRCDDGNAAAWIGLGAEGGGVVVGRAYDAKACYEEALRLDPGEGTAWFNLAGEGGGTIADRLYDAKACHEQALHCNLDNADAWFSLACEGGGIVADKPYGPTACYEEALRCGHDNAKAWFNLAVEGGGIVAGKTYRKKACFEEALCLDPGNAKAWFNLAIRRGGTVAGRAYDAQACYQEALCLDRDDAEAWFNLAGEGGGILPGRACCGVKDCYEEALRCDDGNAAAWIGLGAEGGGTVAGRAYDEKACYEEALRLDPHKASAWYSLSRMGGGTVGGVPYDEEACEEEALRIDPAVQRLVASSRASP